MLAMVVFFIAFRWIHLSTPDRKSGSAGMPRPISYAVFCLNKLARQPVRAWEPLAVQFTSWVCSIGTGNTSFPGTPRHLAVRMRRCAAMSCLCSETATTEIYTLSLHDALPISPKATSSTLYFDSLTVNAGNGGFLHCIQMDTSVNA